MKIAEDVTREEFEAFEDVRESGVTNMYARNVVCDLADIDTDTYMAIVANYWALKAKFMSNQDDKVTF